MICLWDYPWTTHRMPRFIFSVPRTVLRMTASTASIPRRTVSQPTREGLRLAAIDIGSNSVHMVVAHRLGDGAAGDGNGAGGHVQGARR